MHRTLADGGDWAFVVDAKDGFVRVVRLLDPGNADIPIEIPETAGDVVPPWIVHADPECKGQTIRVYEDHLLVGSSPA
jgi:hypothetical protein